MKDKRSESAICDSNVAVLSNTVEVGAQIVMEIAGNEIANTIDDQVVTPAYLKEAMTARLQSILSTNIGGR